MNFELFLLAFIPLFVAFDAIGIIPLYLGLTENIPQVSKDNLVISANITALIICLVFLFVGNIILKFLGITVNDFRIAGGIILLILSITELLFYSSRARDIEPSEIGIVPIGIPLIAGPAVLTTILISVNEYGYYYSIASLFLNLIIMFFALYYASAIKKVLRESGSKAFAKVAALLLAAIAVMMIRVGIVNSFK
jgi:multiple antibiotic resistance protein